jgi:branched-chain amino acid transport system substrate-binding protein
MKLLSLIANATGIAAALTIGAVPSAVAQEVLKVGAMFPLTGPAGVFGNQNFQGLEVAADLVNERGGIRGRKVVLVKGDANSTAAAISETNRLITTEGVRILTGSSTSGVSLTATQEAERSGAFYWEGMGVANQITERGFKRLFRFGLNAGGLGLPSLDFAIKVLAPAMKLDPRQMKVALLAEDSGFGSDISSALEKMARAEGVNLVMKENYSAKTTDLSSLILKMRSLQPDVVIVTQFINDAILLQRQMKELQFVPKAFLGTGAGQATLSLGEALGKDVNGIFSSSYPPDVNPAGLSDKARKDLEEFRRRYEARHKVKPAVQESLGFVVGIALFEDVIAKARSVDPDDLRAAAAAADVPLGSYINGWGMRFDAQGQNTRAFGAVIQWQNQAMRVVYPPQYKLADPIMVPLPAWNRR